MSLPLLSGLICLCLAVVELGRTRLGVRRVRMAEEERVLDAIHEIRRPLCALLLGLEMLAREARKGPASSGAWVETAEALKAEVLRVGAATDQLAGISTESCSTRSVDLTQLAREVAAGWRPQLADSGREIIVEVGPTVDESCVLANPSDLGQAASNLVANAAEHGEGPVRLKIERKGDAVELSVRNRTRPVMTAPELANGARRAHGRGLRIAAELVRSNGGRLALNPGRIHEAVLAIDIAEGNR